MTTQYTIGQAQALTLETLDAMTLEQLAEVVTVLDASQAKKSRLKLDQVKAIIEKRKKQAKKAGAVEEQQELLLVENSVKKTLKRQPRKKADVEEPEETEADETEDGNEDDVLDTLKVSDVNAMNAKEVKAFLAEHFGITTNERNVKKLRAILLEAISPEDDEEEPEAPKAKPETKATTPDIKAIQKQMEALQKQLKALESENNKLKLEKFPEEIETQKDGTKLVAIDFKEVADVQKALVDTPYKVYMQVHEGLDATATTFVVVFMNAEKLVLVDKSRQVNSVLDLEVKHMTPTTVQIDKRDCPYQFYMMTKAK